MKIAVLGRGNVGAVLGSRWADAGHSVVYGVRRPSSSDESLPAEASQGAEVIVLALPAGSITDATFEGLELDGKVVIDCTNPISSDFSGMDWGSEASWGERVARMVPTTRVVKAFNTIGANIMANPQLGAGKAALLIAGDDASAKAAVSGIAAELGFDPVDAGPLSQSRWLESFAWLWISMAMKSGHGREFAFSYLKR